MTSPKAIFPLFYFGLYLITAGATFLNFRHNRLPTFDAVVSGEINRATIDAVIGAVALAIIGFTIVIYVALELYEDTEITNYTTLTSMNCRIVDYAGRFLCVGIVTLKIVRWDQLDNMFLFLLALSLVTAFWFGFARNVLVWINHEWIYWAGLAIVVVGSIFGFVLSFNDDLNRDYAIPIVLVSFIIAIFTTGFFIVILVDIFPSLKKVVMDYITKW